MFDIEFLHVIREFEYAQIVKRLPAGASILEIGGGTGYQARRLSQDGYQVTSIDVPNSNYANQQEFDVQAYDGVNIPFPSGSFDVVFSSNVLEHVLELERLQNEMKRVLRPGGYCVHLMPTGSWRFWTSCAHYMELIQRLAPLLPRLIPRGLSRYALGDALNVLRLILGTARGYAIVPRHGERGNALTEVVTFSPRHWRRHFILQNYEIQEIAPAGLFYTGHMIFGKRLALRPRQSLSYTLGSACAIYVVRPRAA
jgi:SAM-dependent methyltransferase